MCHNVRSSPNIWRFHGEASWKYILSKRPMQYCLFYDYKRLGTSNLSIFCINLCCYYLNFRWYDWKIGWYTPLIIIKQAILVWSFRQNIFPACFHQKSSISARDEVAVTLFVENACLLLRIISVCLPQTVTKFRHPTR